MSDWYYYTQLGERVGPISAATLKLLARQGVLSSGTVVENSGGKAALAGKIRGLFPEITPPKPTPPIANPSPVKPLTDPASVATTKSVASQSTFFDSIIVLFRVSFSSPFALLVAPIAVPIIIVYFIFFEIVLFFTGDTEKAAKWMCDFNNGGH